MKLLLSVCAGIVTAGITGAAAQVTFVNPNAGGGYTVITPGQSPTFIDPNGGGGFTAIRPGSPPTFINPNGAGGYTIMTPGVPQTAPQFNTGPYGYRRY